MPSVLILAFTDTQKDARVQRQINCFGEEWQVTLASEASIGRGKWLSSNAERSFSQKVLTLGQTLLGIYEKRYWGDPRIKKLQEALQGKTFDLVIANDLETVPLALSVAGTAPVIADMHEYAPREWEDVLRWRLLHQKYVTALCRRYLPQAQGHITVCGSIAEEYRKQFGISPVVMTNAPPMAALAPTETQGDTIHLVHHGGASPSREIELMISAMGKLGRKYSLDLFLVPTRGSLDYYQHLCEKAKAYPNVCIKDPIPISEVVPTINRYDAGIFLLPPNNFNYHYALPNKFFDFIQARLAIVTGPSPEMARVIEEERLGVVSPDFSLDAFVTTLQSLNRESIDFYKSQAHHAAEKYCFENNCIVMKKLISEVMQKTEKMRP